MSDFSLTLVLRFKTSKIAHDMAKVSIKSERITPFGGIFHVRELFSRYVGPVIDKVLGLRCTSCGYQYSEIAGSLSSVYFCGGDCVEERNDGGKKGRGETSLLLAVVLPPACCCSVSCLL